MTESEKFLSFTSKVEELACKHYGKEKENIHIVLSLTQGETDYELNDLAKYYNLVKTKPSINSHIVIKFLTDITGQ